jgi:phage terminase large subunit GpA-like protein
MMSLRDNLYSMIDLINTDRMNLSPSEWAEKYRRLTSDISTVTGPYRYDLTPYLRELVDTLSPYHPAKIVAIQKASQLGMTEGLLVNGILWMIANAPGNTLALSADDQLSKEMVESRLDQGISSCGIQHLIGPNTIRKKNQRTGDTSSSKEYAGGRLFAGGLKGINKLANQRSIKYGFFDDWDTADISDKREGNLFDIIQQRFKTASKTMKQYYISTPREKPSNIEHVYLKGDQRKWNVPCPLCGSYIELIWYKKNSSGDPVGVYFEKDKNDRLIEDSVCYICQECGGSFKEKYKYEINLNGKWIPTTEPSQYGFYSYRINSLPSPPHAFTWTDYARQWIDIFKDGITRNSKLKPFKNQVLGETWEERTRTIKANKLMENRRSYDVGVVPNQQSKDDGNGRIVLLTFASDLNGTIDDARVDYDVWAHSESGSVYSIDQGSVGTYQPGLKPDGRDLMSYRPEATNNVWDYMWNEIINVNYPTDDNDQMRILAGGVDSGYMTQYAYQFVDSNPFILKALKGSDEDKYTKVTADLPLFKKGKERVNLFLLHSDKIKDNLAEMISLKWTEGNTQPPGFLNFPRGTTEKYTKKYFEQFEAESRVLETNDENEATGYKWKKKNNMSQNHFFDTSYYNLAIRDIFVDMFLRELNIKNGTWADFSAAMKNILDQ